MTTLREVLRRLLGGGEASVPARAAGGPPRSANQASSFHLFWTMPDGQGPFVEASAVLEVVEAPSVDRLYFWALQATFVEGGRRFGAAHLGLQWHPQHPGRRAANWGGYKPEGGELDGSVSPFPSARGNPNTRDFAWEMGRPYRLTVRRVGGEGAGGAGEWAGLIDGVEFRRLSAGGSHLDHLSVWSEVFADCDHPAATVRWSGFEAVTTGGDRVTPTAVRVNYQSAPTGGCVNTDSRPDPRPADPGFLQTTATLRTTPQNASFPFASP